MKKDFDYIKRRGGFSGGDKNTSGGQIEVLLELKQKNLSFKRDTLTSNTYFAVKDKSDNERLSDLQFILLMKTWKLFFCLLLTSLSSD